MSITLSNQVQRDIDALCESIARKDQLGADVQEELRGHIEDKVIAYLEGKEALTEADALLLARGHFGDPAIIAGLGLQRATTAVGPKIGFRLFIVSTVTLAAHCLAYLFAFLIYFVDTEYLAESHALLAALVAAYGRSLLAIALVCGTMRFVWHTKLWLSSAFESTAILSAAIAVSTWLFVPEVHFQAAGVWDAPFSMVVACNFHPGLVLCVELAECSVWIWWSRLSPRGPATVFLFVFSWFLLGLIMVTGQGLFAPEKVIMGHFSVSGEVGTSAWVQFWKGTPALIWIAYIALNNDLKRKAIVGILSLVGFFLVRILKSREQFRAVME